MRIELYGRLREAGLGDSVELAAPEEATAAGLLEALRSRPGAETAVFDGAVLATETEVLAPSDPVPAGRRLAVLPPVCGG